MSIIEETLRNLQDENDKESVRHDIPVVPVEEKKASTNNKSTRNLTFVVIAIVLILLGLGAYFGLEKYQSSLNSEIESLSYNAFSLESLITPVDVSKKEVVSHENTGVIDTNQVTYDTSDKEAQEVGSGYKEAIIERDLPESSMRDGLNTEREVGSPLYDNQGLGSSQNDISNNDVLPGGTVDAVVSNQFADASAVFQEAKPRQELDAKEHPVSVNQSDRKQLSAEPVENLIQSEEKPSASLFEENIFGKQLKQARHLINIGSYNEAIDILRPIIDRQEETWDTYLLMGAAHLGLGELDYAETYSEMGLAMNGKVPQLWLQCAIVEQERGKHEVALRILNESERLAPDMPEVQLNIGYSYDAIGNQRLSVKAYNSFLKLTEGNPAYMMVRYKVLERLRNLK